MKTNTTNYIAVIIMAIAMFLSACTRNTMTRMMGGSMTQDLPSNMKLVNVTWKDADLWTLYRPMRSDETPETYTFQENSELGMLNGTVTIVEHRQSLGK